MPAMLKRITRFVPLVLMVFVGLLAVTGILAIVYVVNYSQNGGPILIQVDTSTPTPVRPTPTPSVDAVPKPGAGLMYDAGTKIVNLADPGGRRYLKITVFLEFVPHDLAYYTLAGEARAEAQNEFNQEMASKKPLIDDALTGLLSAKTFEDVYSLAGKEELKAEILERLEELLHEDHVVNVYFTDFIVQ